MHPVEQNALRCILDSWSKDHLNFAILGRLPDESDAGGDVDLAIHPNDLRAAITRLYDLIESNQWCLIRVLQHETTCWYAIIQIPGPRSSHFIKLDLCTDYRINGRLFITAQTLTEGAADFCGRGWIQPRQEVQAYYYLVKSIAKTRLNPAVYDYINQRNDAVFQTLLSDNFKAKEQELINRWLKQGILPKPDEIKYIFDQFCQRRPKAYWGEFKRIYNRIIHPSGLHLVLTGPDGVGKSTIRKMLIQDLAPCFRRIDQHHLFTPLTTDLIEKPRVPYQKPPFGALGSLIKLLTIGVRCLRFFAQHIWFNQRRSTLIVSDRYILDVIADPRRFRISLPSPMVTALINILPQPDLNVVLTAEPEIIQARKSEVPVEHTKQQIEQFLIASGKSASTIVVDASSSAEETTQNIVTICCLKLSAQQSQYGWPY